MKFTKNNMLLVSVLIGVAIIGYQLSLKTMEKYPVQKIPYHELMLNRFGWAASRLLEANLNKVENFTSQEALDEFRNKGTIKNEPLDQLVSNDWAFNVFKPAMVELVYPWDNNIQKLISHTDQVIVLAFSPDSTHLISGSFDDSARIWTLQKGFWKESQVVTGHRGDMYFMGLSPDDTRLATVLDDGVLRIQTLQIDGTYGPPKELVGPAVTSENMLTKITFSPDNTHLGIGFRDDTIHVWTLQADGSYGQPHVLNDEGHVTSDIVFSSDGSRMVSGSADHGARVWTLQADGSYGQPYELSVYTIGDSLIFSSDGSCIVSDSADPTIHIWRLQADGTYGQPYELRGHTGKVTSIALSPDGIHLVSGSVDHTVRIWRLQADGTYGAPYQLSNRAEDSGSLVFSPDGTHLACALSNYALCVWTLQTDGTYGQPYELSDQKGLAVPIVFSPDGTYLAYGSANGSEDGTVRVCQQVDLVGNDNVANKIMLLQLFNRGDKDVLENKPYLQEVFNTFDDQAKAYLAKKYKLSVIPSGLKVS